MSKSYEEIENERAKRIQKYVNDKDLNIRVSWAINNAVNIVQYDEDNPMAQELEIREWAEWFLTYFEELKAQEAEKIIQATEEEQAL